VGKGEKRVEQVGTAGCEGVSMCAMCFVNLTGAAQDGVVFNDISHYLRRAFVS